jgi:hypothetical protein
VLTPRGEWRTPMLFGVLDDRSRKRREQFARFRLTLARSVRTAGVAAV